MCLRIRTLLVVGVDGFLFFKQKTAYEMGMSDWSSDVCSSDLESPVRGGRRLVRRPVTQPACRPAGQGVLLYPLSGRHSTPASRAGQRRATRRCMSKHRKPTTMRPRQWRVTRNVRRGLRACPFPSFPLSVFIPLRQQSRSKLPLTGGSRIVTRPANRGRKFTAPQCVRRNGELNYEHAKHVWPYIESM